MALVFRYQVNMTHIRQSMLDYGLRFPMPPTHALEAVCVITGLVLPTPEATSSNQPCRKKGAICLSVACRMATLADPTFQEKGYLAYDKEKIGPDA